MENGSDNESDGGHGPTGQENDDDVVIDPAFISTGLEDFLKTNSIGKEILKAYEKSAALQLPLRKNIRSKLVRLIITREKDAALHNVDVGEALSRFVITKERFEQLSHEITLIFKYEYQATYYTEFVKQGDKCILTNGKLWHHYNYVKRCLRESELLARTNKQKAPENLPLEHLQLINENEHIVWLSSHVDPWAEVCERWKLSFALRRQLLMEPNLTVQEYLDKFPSLQEQRGLDLYSLEFELLYPDKGIIAGDKWIKIKEFLIPYMHNEVRTKSIEEQTLINLLQCGELSAEREDFILFYQLCHLIAPKREGKKKSDRPNKLSLQERRESFIFRVETGSDIRPRLIELRTRSTSFQPTIIAVGPVLLVEAFYIAVNDKLLQVNTAFDAVVLALKIFYALDCKYPENSQTIWVFLQKILFDIDLPLDVTTVQSNIILGHLKTLN